MGQPKNIYVSSRASIPQRASLWRKYRDKGHPILSSWIDQAGPGEVESFSTLWKLIDLEIKLCDCFVFYAEPEDFPFKGALVEVGMALAYNKPVRLVLPNLSLEGETSRPLGSWHNHPLCSHFDTLEEAFTTEL